MSRWVSVTSHEDPKGGFGDYAKELLDNPELSDVAIVLDNDDLQEAETTPTKTFHGLRVILATMSDYFRTMLFGSFLEAGKKEIRLTGVPYSVFVDLMRYVYLGWNCPDEKSLEELVEYYSLARMLLLDAKMKPCFDRWMSTKVKKCPEDDVLKLLSLALEWDLRHLKSKSTEHFCLIANECLACSSFVELPLQTINYIVDLDDMHCYDTDLKTAIQAWIDHHKQELSAETIEELNEDVNKHSEYCFDTEEFEEHSLYEDQNQPTPEEQPAGGLVPLSKVLNASQLYSYRCDFQLQSDCIVLKAVRINLIPNLQYGPEYGRIKSEFQLNFEVGVCTQFRERDEYNRSLTVRYDFTQDNDRVPVTIFFPDFHCCKGTRLWFKFCWLGAGVQPRLQEYGPIEEDTDTVQTDSSYVSHMIYKFKYCRTHPDSEEDIYEDTDEDSDEDEF